MLGCKVPSTGIGALDNQNYQPKEQIKYAADVYTTSTSHFVISMVLSSSTRHNNQT